MTRPAKPVKNPKTAKNQPQPFRESLAATPSQTGLAAPSMPRVSMRVTLWVIWALATIAAGIGVGRLIADRATNTAATAEAPTPVAQANIHPPVASAQIAIAMPVAVSQPDLTVKPGATSVNQAQAGSPFTQQATAYYQPA